MFFLALQRIPSAAALIASLEKLENRAQLVYKRIHFTLHVTQTLRAQSHLRDNMLP